MSGIQTGENEQHQPGRWEIRLKGHLAARWSAWFDGLTLSDERNGTTLLAGPVADQAALHGLLQKVRDLALPLISVTCIDPSNRLYPPANPVDAPEAQKE